MASSSKNTLDDFSPMRAALGAVYVPPIPLGTRIVDNCLTSKIGSSRIRVNLRVREEIPHEDPQDQASDEEDKDEDDVPETFHDAVEEQEDEEDDADDEEDELEDDEDTGAFEDAVADVANEDDNNMQILGALDQRQSSISAETLEDDGPESEEETTCCWQPTSMTRHTSPSHHPNQENCQSDSDSQPIGIEATDGDDETHEDEMSSLQDDNATQSSSSNILGESHPHTLNDTGLPQSSEMADAIPSTPQEDSITQSQVVSTSPQSSSMPVCMSPRAGSPPPNFHPEPTEDNDLEHDSASALNIIRLVLRSAYPQNPRAGLPMLTAYARCLIEQLQAGKPQLLWHRRHLSLRSPRTLTRPPPDRRSQLTAGLCLRPYQVQRSSQRGCGKYPVAWTGPIRIKSLRAPHQAQNPVTSKSTALPLSCAQEARMGIPPVLAEVAPVASGPRSTDAPRRPGSVVTTSRPSRGDASSSLLDDSRSSLDVADVRADAVVSAVQSPPTAPAASSNVSAISPPLSVPSSLLAHPSPPSSSSAPPSITPPTAPISTSPPAPQLPVVSGATAPQLTAPNSNGSLATLPSNAVATASLYVNTQNWQMPHGPMPSISYGVQQQGNWSQSNDQGCIGGQPQLYNGPQQTIYGALAVTNAPIPVTYDPILNMQQFLMTRLQGLASRLRQLQEMAQQHLPELRCQWSEDQLLGMEQRIRTSQQSLADNIQQLEQLGLQQYMQQRSEQKMDEELRELEQWLDNPLPLQQQPQQQPPPIMCPPAHLIAVPSHVPQTQIPTLLTTELSTPLVPAPSIHASLQPLQPPTLLDAAGTASSCYLQAGLSPPQPATAPAPSQPLENVAIDRNTELPSFNDKGKGKAIQDPSPQGAASEFIPQPSLSLEESSALSPFREVGVQVPEPVREVGVQVPEPQVSQASTQPEEPESAPEEPSSSAEPVAAVAEDAPQVQEAPASSEGVFSSPSSPPHTEQHDVPSTPIPIPRPLSNEDYSTFADRTRTFLTELSLEYWIGLIWEWSQYSIPPAYGSHQDEASASQEQVSAPQPEAAPSSIPDKLDKPKPVPNSGYATKCSAATGKLSRKRSNSARHRQSRPQRHCPYCLAYEIIIRRRCKPSKVSRKSSTSRSTTLNASTPSAVAESFSSQALLNVPVNDISDDVAAAQDIARPAGASQPTSDPPAEPEPAPPTPEPPLATPPRTPSSRPSRPSTPSSTQSTQSTHSVFSTPLGPTTTSPLERSTQIRSRDDLVGFRPPSPSLRSSLQLDFDDDGESDFDSDDGDHPEDSDNDGYDSDDDGDDNNDNNNVAAPARRSSARGHSKAVEEPSAEHAEDAAEVVEAAAGIGAQNNVGSDATAPSPVAGIRDAQEDARVEAESPTTQTNEVKEVVDEETVAHPNVSLSAPPVTTEVATPAVNHADSGVTPAALEAKGQDAHAASRSRSPEAAEAAEVIHGVVEASCVAPPVTTEIATPDVVVQSPTSPTLPSAAPRQETVQQAAEMPNIPVTSAAEATDEAAIQDTVSPMETEVASAPLANASSVAEEIVQDHLQGPPATPATDDMEVIAPEHQAAQPPQSAVTADQGESSMDLVFDPTEAQQGYVQGGVPQAADAASDYLHNAASMNEANGMFMGQSTDMEATFAAEPSYQWQGIPTAPPHPQFADATHATSTENWSWMYDDTPTTPLAEGMDVVAGAPHDVPQAGHYSDPDTTYASFSSNDLQGAVFAAVPTLPEAPMCDSATTSYTAQAPPQQTDIDVFPPAELQAAMSDATELLEKDPEAFKTICDQALPQYTDAPASEYNAISWSTGIETSDLRSTSSWDSGLRTTQPQPASATISSYSSLSNWNGPASTSSNWSTDDDAFVNSAGASQTDWQADGTDDGYTPASRGWEFTSTADAWSNSLPVPQAPSGVGAGSNSTSKGKGRATQSESSEGQGASAPRRGTAADKYSLDHLTPCVAEGDWESREDALALFTFVNGLLRQTGNAPNKQKSPLMLITAANERFGIRLVRECERYIAARQVPRGLLKAATRAREHERRLYSDDQPHASSSAAVANPITTPATTVGQGSHAWFNGNQASAPTTSTSSSSATTQVEVSTSATTAGRGSETSSNGESIAASSSSQPTSSHTFTFAVQSSSASSTSPSQPPPPSMQSQMFTFAVQTLPAPTPSAPTVPTSQPSNEDPNRPRVFKPLPARARGLPPPVFVPVPKSPPPKAHNDEVPFDDFLKAAMVDADLDPNRPDPFDEEAEQSDANVQMDETSSDSDNDASSSSSTAHSADDKGKAPDKDRDIGGSW